MDIYSPVVAEAVEAKTFLDALGSPLPKLRDLRERFMPRVVDDAGAFELWLSVMAWSRGLR